MDSSRLEAELHLPLTPFNKASCECCPRVFVFVFSAAVELTA